MMLMLTQHIQSNAFMCVSMSEGALTNLTCHDRIHVLIGVVIISHDRSDLLLDLQVNARKDAFDL